MRGGGVDLDHYFSWGSNRSISFPLAPRGQAFQERVWQLLREIHGGDQTYGQLARIFLVVGQAVGRHNRTQSLTIVPCHRVMGKDGQLTGCTSGLRSQTLAAEGITWKGQIDVYLCWNTQNVRLVKKG